MKSFSINEIKQIFISFLDLIKKHREGFYFYITSIVNSVNVSIDTLMGSFLLGFRDLGFYNIASNISKYVIGVIPSALSFFIFPVFLREEKRSYLSTGILIVAFFVLPLVISSLYGEPFMKLIAGGYEEYAKILFYFLPLIILSPLQYSLLRYFTAKKNFFFFKYLVIVTIINILLNYFFVKEMNFGVNGLAIATSISYLILSFLIVFNARDILPKMFPIKIIFIGVTLSFILSFFIPYFKKSFSNEIEAMIYALFSLAIAYSLNTFLVYILFKDDFKNLLKKLLGLINVAINKQKWLMKSR
jgi:PST family polysaccharide transporter/lipopolysaccharide exporter